MQTKYKIFISQKILDSGVKLLQAQGHDLQIWEEKAPITREELLKHSRNCDILISMLNNSIDADFLNQCKNLKLIANYAVGTNNIDLVAAKKLNIIVTNTPDVLSLSTAEIAVALILEVGRGLKLGNLAIMNNLFQGFGPTDFLGPTAFKKTVGIIGMGRIGRAVAEIMNKGFQCPILYTAQTSTSLIGDKVELDFLLRNSDIISIHCPLSEKTKNLIAKNEFELMKKTAILINTARGEIVNTDDLVWALENNVIYGAGLDVTAPEPLPENHQLKNLSNCFILPHIGSASIETREQMSLLCAYNIIDFSHGIPPRTQVKV